MTLWEEGVKRDVTCSVCTATVAWPLYLASASQSHVLGVDRKIIRSTQKRKWHVIVCETPSQRTGCHLWPMNTKPDSVQHPKPCVPPQHKDMSLLNGTPFATLGHLISLRTKQMQSFIGPRGDDVLFCVTFSEIDNTKFPILTVRHRLCLMLLPWHTGFNHETQDLTMRHRKFGMWLAAEFMSANYRPPNKDIVVLLKTKMVSRSRSKTNLDQIIFCFLLHICPRKETKNCWTHFWWHNCCPTQPSVHIVCLTQPSASWDTRYVPFVLRWTTYSVSSEEDLTLEMIFLLFFAIVERTKTTLSVIFSFCHKRNREKRIFIFVENIHVQCCQELTSWGQFRLTSCDEPFSPISAPLHPLRASK